MDDEPGDDWDSDRIGWWVVIMIMLGLLLALLVLALREDSVDVVGAVGAVRGG